MAGPKPEGTRGETEGFERDPEPMRAESNGLEADSGPGRAESEGLDGDLAPTRAESVGLDGVSALTRPESDALQWDAELMRRLGHRVVDRVVERWAGLREDRAWNTATRVYTEALLRESAPDSGRDPEEVIERVLRDVLPYAGRIDHPRFFAFIPSSPTWPSFLAHLLTSGFNVFQGTWLESAGPSQVELVVIDWFREWLGMPETAGGIFTSGGSAATLNAMVAARHAAGNDERLVLYESDQCHAAVHRAAHICGFRHDNLRHVPTDDHYRLDVAALARAVRRDRSDGRTPFMVSANAGATNTGAIDPLDDLADLCEREGLWLHIDAAYGGFAVLDNATRPKLKGIERADSVVLDPHKWLFQPYETGCLLVRDAALLRDAFRIMPEYMQDTDMTLEHVNFADRGLQLSRSFRALRVWMSIQMFGLDEFRVVIRRAMELALDAEAHIRESAQLELLSPASLGVVCYRFHPPGLDPSMLDSLNRDIQEEIVESGFAMISSTRLQGEYSLRLCILNYRSTRDDVRATLARVEEIGGRRVKAAACT